MAYFFESPPDLTDPDIAHEWARLDDFKKDISKKMIYRLYNNEEKILEIVCKDICANIREHDLLASE